MEANNIEGGTNLQHIGQRTQLVPMIMHSPNTT